MVSRTNFSLGVLGLWTTLSLIFAWVWSRNGLAISSSTVYTYRGHDFPENLPLSHMVPAPIRVTMEENNEYPVKGWASDDQWFGLTSTSVGYVRLGPEDRLFMVTMFHELHCLRMLNLAFEVLPQNRSRYFVDDEHVKHCLDYLRQTALCSADITLERGDFATRNFDVERLGATHTCSDWSALYAAMEENWTAWSNRTKP